MIAPATKVLREALRLAPEARAEVAAEILASLDPHPEDEEAVQAAWAQEIERRAAAARRSGGDAIDWRPALAEIDREFSRS